MQDSALASCTTLPEIEAWLPAAYRKVRHWGLDYVLHLRTLFERKRSSDVFKSVFEHLYITYKPLLSDSTLSKATKLKLFLLDFTGIGLFNAISRKSGRRHSINGEKKDDIKKETFIEGLTRMQSFMDGIKRKLLKSGSYICYGPMQTGFDAGLYS